MRHCEQCGFLGVSGYEYPESYCTVGVQEDDPKFDEFTDCPLAFHDWVLRWLK